MPGAYKVTARLGPRVTKTRHATFDEALAAIDAQLGGAGGEPERRVLGRTYAPVGQVAGRFEIRGPGGVRGGVDVRGDGSAEAYRGWVRKEVVAAEAGERAVDTLRRALSA